MNYTQFMIISLLWNLREKHDISGAKMMPSSLRHESDEHLGWESSVSEAIPRPHPRLFPVKPCVPHGHMEACSQPQSAHPRPPPVLLTASMDIAAKRHRSTLLTALSLSKDKRRKEGPDSALFALAFSAPSCGQPALSPSA